MRIAMIGSGYVGLVSGACFSEFGVNTVCVDKDADKIARLTAGEIPIFEPGLDDLVRKNVHAGRLSFTMDLASAVASANAVFIAVGTPSRRGDGHADLSYVYAAAEELARGMDGKRRRLFVVEWAQARVALRSGLLQTHVFPNDIHDVHRGFELFLEIHSPAR